MTDSVVIVGAGHAGGQTAISLRQQKFRGRITILGDEPYPPYQRPPLSKKYLAGELELDRLFLRREKFYADHDVELRLSARVDAIDRADRRLTLENGESIEYEKLVLATGSRVRRLDLPGSDLDGVHYLRSIDDVRKIRKYFRRGARLIVIGAGYIGLEVAAVATAQGLFVTVLETAERVMSRVVSPVVSAFFEKIHREAGVDIRCGVRPGAGFVGDGGLKAIRADDGTLLPADIAIVGVGILPNVEIAESAGIECENGILVDEYCRTSDAHILAVGDCTNHPNRLLGRRLRLESVHNAQEQAKTAAATLCGTLEPYAQVPWFWSDQYDLKLQIAGLTEGYEQVILRGNPDERAFAAFYLREGRLIAVDAINSAREFMLSKKLIAAGARLDPEILADTEIAFKDLADAALS